MKVLELTNTESSNEEDITGLSLHVGVNTQASIQFLKTKPSFIVRLIVITIVVTIVDVWLEESPKIKYDKSRVLLFFFFSPLFLS